MKKTMKPVTVSLLAMSLLSACGNNSGSNAATDDGGNAASGKKVEIEFFQNKTEAKATFDKLVAQFNAANPDIVVSQINPPDAETVLKTRAAKQDLPDVIGLGATDTYKTLSASGLFEDFTGDPLVSSIQPAYVKMLNDLTGSSELNGIPFSANASGVIYNKAMFKEAGVAVPTTWDEFIAAAQKFKDSGKYAFYLTLKDSWTSLTPFNSLEPSILGTDYFKKRTEGSVTFKDSFREIAEKQLKLTEFAQKDIFGKGYNDGNTAFAKGESAMYLQGVWAIPEIMKANPSLELGVFPFPATNDPAKNKVISGVDTLLTISKDSKHKEEAKKFVEFLLQPENVTAYITEQKAFPAVKGVTQDDPAMDGFKEAFTSGKLADFADHYIPGAMKVDTIIQSFLNSKDIDAYLKQLDTEWDKVANRK
ncbi:ABC transporter substrate-binding protein [Paenibacillus jilunlii]|uniref:ABC transporter substrate-binding protein n=1 Tax=Paenibacillus jilunlii TaxID=682956 RepID=A0A1G9XYG9_9BACL|nr:extracellular solute-binding protein [Paenibacillus jilunlii]KWX79262.1 ABC transporter substrate-binding protein [Paenibacillus jilunlii]SDN01215.1 carbohydrate ABC transporter substrate-binding protein, CUT1 family [Paenibacillus jilunlii]